MKSRGKHGIQVRGPVPISIWISKENSGPVLMSVISLIELSNDLITLNVWLGILFFFF